MTGRDLGFVASRALAIYALLLGLYQLVAGLSMSRMTVYDHGAVWSRSDPTWGTRLASVVGFAVYLGIAWGLWARAEMVGRRLVDASPGSAESTTDWLTLGMRLIGVYLIVVGAIDIATQLPITLLMLNPQPKDLDGARSVGAGLGALVPFVLGWWLIFRTHPASGHHAAGPPAA